MKYQDKDHLMKYQDMDHLKKLVITQMMTPEINMMDNLDKDKDHLTIRGGLR